MASDYCYGIEMQHALERHAEGSCLVIPILLRPTHWEGEPFGKLQLLPIHKSKEEWLEEGLSHYKANRFSEAITAYTQAIRRDRNYALAYHYQGEANYCLNNFAEALADFEIALSIDTLLLCAYTWKGNTLSRLNQTRKAIIAYAEGLIIADKTPQDQWNAQFYYDKSKAFYGLKFYTEALIDCDQAIHLI